jgi:hypothetical protein
MPDETARVGVALDAMVFDESYCALDRLSEPVLRVDPTATTEPIR